MKKKRIAVAISFNGRNCQNAKRSIVRFSRWFARSVYYDVVWVLMIPSGRKTLEGASELGYASAVRAMITAAGGLPVHVVDNDTTMALRAAVPDQIPNPVGDDFNYGGTKNLAHIAAMGLGADVVLRIDPATSPPLGTCDEVISAIEGHLMKQDSLTSGQYLGRIALRYKHVPHGRRTGFLHLVERFTGIDPLSQVTSGALSGSKLPGSPAIPLNSYLGDDGSKKLSLVWFIDDGAVQRITSSSPIDSLLVPRIDLEQEGSYPKGKSEYFRSVVAAVYLCAVMDGEQPQLACQVLDRFIEELCNLIGDRFSSDELLPVPLARRIDEGWENYRLLRGVWPDLCARLGPVAVANAYRAD